MSQRRERLAEAWQLVRLAPWVLRLLWSSNRVAAFWVVLFTVFQAAVPVIQLTVTKMFMDQMVLLVSVPADQRTSELVNRALLFLGLETAAILLGVVSALIAGHARNALQESLVLSIQEKVLWKSVEIDLAAYESPDYYDLLQRAQQQAGNGPVLLLGASIEIAQGALTLLSVGALIFLYQPWISLVLVATTIPSFWAMIHYGWRRFIIFDRRTPAGRRAQYFTDVLTSDTYAKEVRIWGLGPYLIDAAMRLHRRFRKENVDLSRGQTLATIAGEALSTAGYYGCYLTVVFGVVAGRLTIGDLALYGGAFMRMQTLFEGLLTAVANSYEIQLFARYLKYFFEKEPEIVAPESPQPAPRLSHSLEVRDVDFVYPGTEEVVLRDMSFEIRPGECVAVVGENGAGKTTLVKLLLRLYDPSAGQILADGTDLRDMNPDAWRQCAGVVFQDYARFQLTARENVGIGKVTEMANTHLIELASRKAGIDDVLSGLPEAYESLLGRQFEGGNELSLGQWQRVALARALLRDAPLLIMDEPTAAMDARAEYELYKSLKDLAKDRMTLLISHRFSTVRMAHRILVIEDGKIVEEGSHENLLSRDTRYARLFRMQAEGYQMS